MTCFLITRPEADAAPFAKTIEQLGHQALVSPVMEIFCNSFALPNPDQLSGFVITSRNGLRCLADQHELSSYLDLPLFAVGKASAALARQHNFKKVIEAAGKASSLVPLIRTYYAADKKKPHILFHPTGVKQAYDLVPPLAMQDITVQQEIAYEAKQVAELTDGARAALDASLIEAVILMSPRSARLFHQLVQKDGLENRLSSVICLSLSPKIADTVRDMGYKDILVAPTPHLEGLLELIVAFQI